MTTPRKRGVILLVTFVAAAGLAAVVVRPWRPFPAPPAAGSVRPRVEGSAIDLQLPPGFHATVFADHVGHARHLAVSDDGTLYANTWSGGYYADEPLPPGGFVVALRDTDGDGRAESIERFGPTAESGATGGTGIAVYEGALYAEEGGAIVRYTLDGKRGATIVSGLPTTDGHPMHPFAIDRRGGLFVNVGSATNVCDGRPTIAGDPLACPELETRAGIWRYDARAVDQHFSPRERFATGIRNAGGIAFDDAGRMLATQHGRDLLGQKFPKIYSPAQGAELPAEELLEVVENGDYGWPRCYFDATAGALLLAPEFGGDGKSAGVCASKSPPLAAFPAHWAPNDVALYRGSLFPAAYRAGVFLAFHGSWNRAPAPQDGYNVVFQPLANGKPSGRFTVFASGFAGAHKDPGGAAHRPAGLAVGRKGELYVADDRGGTIWRITYDGAADAAIASASVAAPRGSPIDEPPPAPPPGFTAEQMTLGDGIFHGRARNGTCSGCHGSDLRGTSVGPALLGSWAWGDGSIDALTRTIQTGVPHPKRFSGAMPAGGGVALSDDEARAVAGYVWAFGKRAP